MRDEKQLTSLLRTLLDRPARAGPPSLPQGLQDLYDGDLYFPDAPSQGPYVIANFVTALDGTVSYKLPGQASGSTISGSNAADRFIMALLRASADAVMIGSHTLHDTDAGGLWIPAETYPGASDLFANYRRNVLRAQDYPLVVVVSGSGRLDLTRAVFQAPRVRTLIVTSAAGEKELARREVRSLPSVQLAVLNDVSGEIDPLDILRLFASQFGIRRLLHEGGPTLFGKFLAARAVDELFLTLSPQIAGRLPQTVRPGLVEQVEFLPSTAPWFDLLAVKQQGQHLYLRYRYSGTRP